MIKHCIIFCVSAFYRYNKKDRELTALQKKFADLEAVIADLESKLASATSEKERWQLEYGVSRLWTMFSTHTKLQKY